jgi:hypothetical protein
MRIDVPSIVNDPQMRTLPYWLIVYPNQDQARRARALARKAYDRTRLAEVQRWRCCWCYCEMRGEQGFKNSATIEHITPRSCGGTDHITNLAIACNRCNNRRGNTPWEDFLQAMEMSRPAPETGSFRSLAFERKMRREAAEQNKRIKQLTHLVRNHEVQATATQTRREQCKSLEAQYSDMLPGLQLAGFQRAKRMRREVDRQLALQALSQKVSNPFEVDSRPWRIYERMKTKVNVDTLQAAA